MMKAGWAEVDITPPVNVPLNGFDTRKTGSTGVHDPLFARALVLDNGRTRLGWLIADLIGFPYGITARIREEAPGSVGMPGDRVMVSATHTHGGPALRPAPEIPADHAAHAGWLEKLPSRLVSALAAAAGRLEPVEPACGRAVCDSVQHNRRFHMKDGTVKMVWDKFDPADVAWLGPVDPAVQVLAFRGRGMLRGAVVQFACHATAVVGGNFLVTADWPGVTCRELKSLAGSPDPWIAVAQGCCGDITPSPPRGTFDICEAKGREVARIAFRAIVRAEPLGSDDLGAVRVPVRLARKKAGPDPSPTGEFHETEVQALKIGDAVVVGLPGEAFVEIGLRVKANSDFRWTFAGSYTNDYDDGKLGYIPTAAEYGGGYEVTASMAAPGSDAALVAAAREAVSRLS